MECTGIGCHCVRCGHLERINTLNRENLELSTELAQLRKQLADLRGDRDTLARELNCYRDPEDCDCEPDAIGNCEACTKFTAIMKATDASGALTRAGKDHP